ncbi:P-II family nitrogen regulator [Thermovenabulum gondwanense]|uniref:Nitrogen regulatory protein P-II n=1 Tax=Thermovenabulum gondwanense TaxID=520767 RepID=A0A161PTS4_9FIRM|nr:hypothetical protein [Thermovenabulum gondwanense]KYO65357.1 hypothetical protein ATZ99_15910 [Thermovenabulum gondwanense]
MYLFVIILNKPEKLMKVLDVMKKNGSKGATVIDSIGAGEIMKKQEEDLPMIASIKRLKEEGFYTNKTILSVVEDIKTLQKIAQAIEDEVGNFSDKTMGIMFSMPLNMVRGGKIGRFDRVFE